MFEGWRLSSAATSYPSTYLLEPFDNTAIATVFVFCISLNKSLRQSKDHQSTQHRRAFIGIDQVAELNEIPLITKISFYPLASAVLNFIPPQRRNLLAHSATPAKSPTFRINLPPLCIFRAKWISHPRKIRSTHPTEHTWIICSTDH